MMLLGVLMVPFPFIQVYIQRRVFKMVARTALGLEVLSFLVLLFYPCLLILMDNAREWF